jgi:hypothetical protein
VPAQLASSSDAAMSEQLFIRFPHLVILTKTLLLDRLIQMISPRPGADEAVRRKSLNAVSAELAEIIAGIIQEMTDETSR